MSAMVDGTETTLPDEALTAEEAAPTPVLTAVEAPANADSGDVFPDELAIGFSDATLDMAEADEELVALEALTGEAPAVEADADELPDEASPRGGDPPEGAISADDGDVQAEGPVGISPEHLQQAEDDEDLHAIEPDGPDPILPDEHTPASGELVTQPSKAPTRKVKAAGLGGVLGAIPAPILAMLDLVHVSDATLGTISSALTILGSVAAAYLTRDKAA